MIVTLLQLLLANFTSNTVPSFKDVDEDSRTETAEDLEMVINREKEILGKAITGILLLMLKWFRCSRSPPILFVEVD